MDDYNVVSLFRAESQTGAAETNRPAAIEMLKRKVRKMHTQHFLTSLMRAVVFGGLLYVGRYVVESSWGNTLAITAAALLLHTLLFSIRGHWKISSLKKAKMYWLQDGMVDQDVSPVFVLRQQRVPARKAV